MRILISKTTHKSDYWLYKYLFWFSLGVEQSHILKYLIIENQNCIEMGEIIF